MAALVMGRVGGTNGFFVSFLPDLTGYGRGSECQQRLGLCYAGVVSPLTFPMS